MIYRFAIQRLPSSELSPNSRAHRFAYNKAKKFDQTDISGYFLHSYPRPPEPLKKAIVTVTVTRRGHQKLDHDNWAARMKGYWDGLVNVGLFADDSTNNIEVQYVFKVDKEKAGRYGLVEFEVKDAGEQIQDQE